MSSARTRVLFVDDELAILDGLRNLLRKERSRWDMVFAVGAQQALSEMRNAPADVVVTDMRMPEMDGVTLLHAIKEEFPSAARIILSGHAGRDATIQSLSVAHQFLSKPCPSELLRTVIERTCQVLRILNDQAMRNAVGRLESVPSVPKAYSELTRLAGDPSADMAAIAKVVESDPAMCARTLQLVNSAYFGIPRRIVSVGQAVSYLGVELLKGLALTASVFASAEARPGLRSWLDEFRSSSVVTARVAKRLVSNPKAAEEAFAAALVHDLGKIIMATGMPSVFSEILRRTTSGESFEQAESAVVEVGHAELGAYLLGLWGLPFSIVEAVAFHHNPSAVSGGPCELLAVVHAADALVERLCHPNTSGSPMIDTAFLERNGFGAELSRWGSIADEEAARMSQ